MNNKLYVAPLVVLLAGAAYSCRGANAPQPAQNTKKSPITSQVTNQSAAAPEPVPSLDELTNLYNKYSSKFSLMVKEAVDDYARRNSYKTMDKIPLKDLADLYKNAFERMKDDSDVKAFFDGLRAFSRRYPNGFDGFVQAVNRLDMTRVTNEKGPLFLGDQMAPAFYDPNLVINIDANHFLPFDIDANGVQNVRVYRTDSGNSAVLVPSRNKGMWGVPKLYQLKDRLFITEYHYGDFWVPREFLHSEPGKEGKDLASVEIETHNATLQAVRTVLEQVKPGMQKEELDELVRQYSNNVLIGEILGDRTIPSLSLVDLRTARERLEDRLATLSQLSGQK